jgi:hypothetical protein
MHERARSNRCWIRRCDAEQPQHDVAEGCSEHRTGRLNVSTPPTVDLLMVAQVQHGCFSPQLREHLIK